MSTTETQLTETQASDALLSDYEHTMMRTFGRPLAVLESGRGCWVTDVDGREYLDFLAGIAVNALGHAHPVFVDAVASQAAKLAHVSNYFASRPQLELAARLERLSGGDRVFFANSGTEANEAAVKIARRTGKPRILALERSFHGRSVGALSITEKLAFRAPFAPLLSGVEFIAPTIEALEAAFAGGPDDVSALVIEPIQGEAGVFPLPDGYLRRARELTSAVGALLVVDEIQTGVGRTGVWFAYQREGIVPDVVTLAKGLGGGFPIGAVITFGAASDLLQPGMHGSTFGGNPLAAAAANAVLGEIERAGLVEAAAQHGEAIRAGVLGLGSPLVTGVRGRGLLLGVQLSAPLAKQLVAAAQRHGLIVNAPNDDSIRLAPPLIVGDAEITEFLARFGAALAEVHAELSATAAASAEPQPSGAAR